MTNMLQLDVLSLRLNRQMIGLDCRLQRRLRGIEPTRKVKEEDAILSRSR